MKITPTLDGTDYISASMEYFKIAKAAELLGCSADDLLHMGVNCKLEILAPVLLEGMCVWAIKPESAGFPEIVGQVKHYFDAAERVHLSWTDLAKIEAIGWTCPTFFYAPSKAQEIDEILQNSFPVSLAGCVEGDTISLSRNEGDKVMMSVTYAPLKLTEQSCESIELRKKHYLAAWYPEEEIVGHEKTTMDNLFISKNELFRLKAGRPNESAIKPERMELVRAPHGNTESNAKIELSVLKAAVYCYINSPKSCKSSHVAWAKTIDEKAGLFWKHHLPPRASGWIERFLGEVLDVKKQRCENDNSISDRLWDKILRKTN